jgi:hypothetical protein
MVAQAVEKILIPPSDDSHHLGYEYRSYRILIPQPLFGSDRPNCGSNFF